MCQRGVKINAEAYQEMVLAPHFAWLRQNLTPDELNGAIWVQDSAPSHSAGSTQAFLRQELGALGAKLVTKDQWPAASPDLNALDYRIWASLKWRVQGRNGTPMDVLRQVIEDRWAALMTPAFVRRIMARWRPRLQLCINAQGSYFEKKWQRRGRR